MREIVPKGTLKAAPANEPTAANALTLHRANPALCKGIQVRATWRDRYGLDTTSGQGLLPGGAALGVSVVDQIAGTDLGKPASSAHQWSQGRAVTSASLQDDRRPPKILSSNRNYAGKPQV